MTDLSDAALWGPTPAEDPLGYPGRVPRHSYLLDHGGVWPLADDEPADLAARHAVLAVGANAGPAALAAKLAAEARVVVLRVTVTNLTVLPSAHLNPRGYWPYAPATWPPSAQPADLAVCLLDGDQLAQLDATEPNYRRRRLDGRRHECRLRSGKLLPDVEAYASVHGVVVDPRIVGVGTPLPPQPVLLAALLAALPQLRAMSIDDPEQLVARIRQQPELAATITKMIGRQLQVRRSDEPTPLGTLGW